jgi:peroxiredoxin
MKAILYLCLLTLMPACTQNNQEKQRAAEGNTDQQFTGNDLPDMPVRMTDGAFRQMNQVKGKSILVLFQPDCDHCQREAAGMSENLEHFNDYQVYFISSASAPELQQFATTYGLSNASNFKFGSTAVDNILNHFGSIPTPSLYIYSENGTLVKKFIGEAPIEEILAAL